MTGLKRLLADKAALTGLLFLALLALAAVLAPQLAPRDPAAVDLDRILEPPSAQALLGADDLGRDLLARLLYAARVSLVAGIAPPLLAVLLGAILGVVAGAKGGFLDALIMRSADVAFAFPTLVLAPALLLALGQGLVNVVLALALTGWTTAARLARAQTLTLKHAPFVEAARVCGVSETRILVRHILPQLTPTLAALFAVSIPEAVLAEAGLSFLGLGVDSQTPSFGLLVAEGKERLFTAPWTALVPGAAIAATALAAMLVADAAQRRR